MPLFYLYTNRERPVLLSTRWIKVWAKRALNMPNLLSILARRFYLTIRGAHIGPLTIIAKVELNGSCRNLSIGEASVISKNTHFALHDKIQIGHHVVINSGVHLLTASHDVRKKNWPSYKKKIVIHDFAWIATNAIILPGVCVGEGAVVGAGAVVSRNVEPFSVVAGNPAIVVGHRNTQLNYDPTRLCAPYESWLGKPTPIDT